MTDPIRRTVQEYTGTELMGCPWRAFADPFVSRVLSAMSFFESGQLAFAVPQPSHRLVAGIHFYQSVSSNIYAKQLELERLERERTARQPPPTRGRRG